MCCCRTARSIGSGYGPIVVAREPLSLDELRDIEIVVPGELTTAFLVLKMALGAGVLAPRAAVRRDPRRGRSRARACRPAHPRRAADVPRRGPREVPRPRRVVAARDRPAAAARRQHRAARHRGRALREVSAILRESIDAALAHRDEALEYALGFGARHGRRARRPRSSDVRQRADAATTATRAGRRSASCSRAQRPDVRRRVGAMSRAVVLAGIRTPIGATAARSRASGPTISRRSSFARWSSGPAQLAKRTGMRT